MQPPTSVLGRRGHVLPWVEKVSGTFRRGAAPRGYADDGRTAWRRRARRPRGAQQELGGHNTQELVSRRGQILRSSTSGSHYDQHGTS